MADRQGWRRSRSIVWLEPNVIRVNGQRFETGDMPGRDETLSALAALPPGPTTWIVEDLWAPSLILKDLYELPPTAEAAEGLLNWRYCQHYGLTDAQFVQSLSVDGATRLLVGMPSERRDGWLHLGLQAGRPVHSLIPRWLWLYNLLAPSRSGPGMLLSLREDLEGSYSGTLAAWGPTLALLRQWQEPATPDVWLEERIYPSAGFLQREGRSCPELLVWGTKDWPACPLHTHLLPADIPLREER